MKTKLHVSYCTQRHLEGFYFTDFKMDGKGYMYMGEIEIDNPFSVPKQSVLNNIKIHNINIEIQEHKAQINLLENKVKDLLCVESKVA